MQRKLSFSVILLFCLTQIAGKTYQSPTSPIDLLTDSSYEYGKNITFRGKINPILPIQQANLSIKIEKSEIITVPLELDKDQKFTYNFDLTSYPVIPFSIIEYWVEVQLKDGTKLSSSSKELRYLDNRNVWKTITKDAFIFHWQNNAVQIEDTVLPITQQAMEKIRTIIPATSVPSVDIYLYNSPGDLREAFPLSQANWMAAHVEPEAHVILLSLSNPPEQLIQLKQQIPHELMHISLWQLSPQSYHRLPVWLNEGLATAAELSPNTEYFPILEKAVHTNSLIPFSALCTGFPEDASKVYLAYAQSGDFVQFLIRSFGSQKLIALIHSYQTADNCLTPIQTTYGSTLNDLTNTWLKEQFGVVSLSNAFNNIAPWLAILLLILFTPFLLYSSFFHHAPHSVEEP